MTIQQLEPITIARGAAVNPSFTLVNQDGTIPDFSECTGYYILSQYGFEDENVLAVTMYKEEKNKFIARLDTAITKELEEGTYTAKIVIEDGSGNQYKFARNVFNVLKDTAEVDVTI